MQTHCSNRKCLFPVQLIYNYHSRPINWLRRYRYREENPSARKMDLSKPQHEHTVRVGPLVNVEALIRSLGFDPVPIFEQSGVDIESYRDPNHKLPFIKSSALLTHCVEATACEHFGLLLGQMGTPSLLGVPGFLARAAPSVEQALVSLVETLDLHDEGGSVALDIGPEFSSLSYSIHLDGVQALEQIYDLSAVMICKILSILCGPEWKAVSVKIGRREPADRAPYRRFFKGPIFFDGTETEVTFSNHCLGRAPPTADELLFRHLEHQAKLMHDSQHGELADILPVVLRSCLLDGKFSAGEIADVLGFHERTLHRRLKDAGTSFRHEIDTARRTLSEQLLTHTGMAIGDIATTLGYADASGFIRAFGRWCGSSPNAWRKHNSAV